MMTPKEILIAARAKIEAPERWTKGAYARHASGRPAGPEIGNADCWCIVGAVTAVMGIKAGCLDAAICRMLSDAAGIEAYAEDITEWNDAPGRTHAEVLATFDRAIAAADSA